MLLWIGWYSPLHAVARIDVVWAVRGKEWEKTLSPFVLLLPEVEDRQIVVLHTFLHGR